MSIKCKKTLKDVSKFQVIYDGCDGVVELYDGCQHSERLNECNNCYGKILKLTYQKFSVKSFKFEKCEVVKKDHYIVDDKNNIIKNMDATELLSQCSIIRKIGDTEQAHATGKTTSMWRAYDQSKTRKTDCKECIARNGGQRICKQEKDLFFDGKSFSHFICPYNFQQEVYF